MTDPLAGPGRTPGEGYYAVSRTVTRLAALLMGVAISVAPLSAQPAAAAVSLTISPITWDVVGLDSNDVSTGPNRFPVGARVCAVGGTATSVTAAFTWDTANANVNLRPGSLTSVDLGSIGNGSCADAYFEAEITRTPAAYDTVRQYHVTATDAGSGATIATPRPRQLYVEHLISQNRNGITSIALNGAPIAAGGTMTLIQGRTYDITMSGYTATQGYNQLEAFTGLPNTIFQVLSVSSTYTSFGGPITSPWSRLYADACTWENDPNNPNYRSCTGGDYKAGGTVSVTYHVRIIGGAGDPSSPLTSLLYDFSGSSYHYNADAGTGVRYVSVVSPSSIPITKTFSPRAITPGATSTLTFKVANPTPDTVAGIAFADTFPAGLVVAGTPAVSYNGCGAGAFSPALSGGETSVSFGNGTIAGYGTCTVTVAVTAASGGTYVNTTGHLFVDTTVDTGNTGTDTLTVAAAAACTPGQTLAHWTVPATTSTNPPDTAGGVPTTKGGGVSTATAVAKTPADSSIITTIGNGDSTSWSSVGYKNAGQTISFTIDTSKYSQVQMSWWMASSSNGPTSVVLAYSTDGTNFTSLPAIANPAATMTNHTQSFTGLTNTSGNTTFRFSGTGALNDQSGADLAFDDISFTGCFNAPPAPTITKTFASDPIVKGATSVLGFTLDNTEVGNVALTGVAFTDVLPAGLTVTSGSAAGCGGTVTRTAPRTIALSGGTLASGGSCSFSVTVTGAAEGAYTNITGYVSTTEGGTSTSYATDTISVIAPPTIAKDFSPASILLDDTSELNFAIGNPNGHAGLTGVAFTDTLPAGLTVASNGGVSTCGGTLTTTAPDVISLAGATLAASASCTFAVTVTGASAGTLVNTTGNVTSTEGGAGGTATATIEVTNPTKRLDLTKQISADGTTWTKFLGVFVGDDVFYRFTVYNAGDVAITGTDIVDPEVAGCTWSGAPNPTLQPGDTAYCTTTVPVVAIAGGNDNTAHATGSTTIGGVVSTNSTATYGTYGLTIDKSATQTYFNAATNVLDYSFLVSNTGTVPLHGPVTVADDKATDEACPALTTVGDFDDWLDPLEAITCTASYTVLAGDVTTKHVTNVASATVDGLTTSTDTVTVPLAAITIDKTSTTTSITEAGQVVPYAITVTNAGELTLTGLTVTDDACDSGPSYSSGDTGADTVFAAGEAWVYTCNRTVSQAEIDAGGNLSNTATADTDQTASKNDTLDIPVNAVDGLTLEKTATETYYTAAGNTISYSYLVSNSGKTTLAGPVTVADNKATVTCPPVVSFAPGDEVTCTATYTVLAGDVTTKHVTNTATATADGVDSNEDSVTVPLAAISVAKTSTTTEITAVDQVVPYQITVTNAGELTLTGLDVTDVMCDAGTAYSSGDTGEDDVFAAGEAWVYTCSHKVSQEEIDAGGNLSNTASADTNETAPKTKTLDIPVTVSTGLTLEKSADVTYFTSAGDVISYSYLVTNDGDTTLAGPVTVADDKAEVACPVVASLAPGASVTCTATYTVLAGDVTAKHVINLATATAGGHDSNEDSVTVPLAAMTINKVADTTLVDAPGDVTFTITVTNTGELALTGISFLDSLDAEAFLVSGDEVNPDVLDAGEIWIYSATVNVTQEDLDFGQAIINAAYASSDQTDEINDTAEVDMDQNPMVALDKSADTELVTVAGDVIGYTMLVTNPGNIKLTGVSMIDGNCDSGPDYQSGDTDVDAALDLTETWTYTCDHTVTQTEIDAGVVSNTATVTTTEEVTDTASVDVTANGAPGLTIEKTADEATFAAEGDTLNYTYVVTNSGGTTLAGPVTVTDDKAEVDCPVVESLAPGDDVTCTATYTVTALDVETGHVTNVAFASADGTDSPDDTVTVPLAAFTVAKTSETTIVGLAGDVVTYEITITNTGEATLTGLVVDDPTCDADPAYASGDTGADEVFEAGEAWVYTCERTVTQDEIDAGGFLSNTVTVTTDEAGEKTDTLDIEIVWDPELTVVKTIVGTSVFRNVGDILRYEYLVTNTGNVTVEGPITVYDDKTSVDCPPVDALAPDESITCTSEYAVTAEDVAAGSVTNIATAAGMVGGQPITSPVVDVRAEQAARPSISVPPSSTVDAKRGAPLTGSSGLVAILVLVAGLAFGLLVARPRRRRTSRRS